MTMEMNVSEYVLFSTWGHSGKRNCTVQNTYLPVSSLLGN